MIDLSLPTPRGLLLLCDAQGHVENLLLDDFEIASRLQTGQLFVPLFEPASWGKSFLFLTQLREDGRVLDWELNLEATTPLMLKVAGVAVGEKLLILATDAVEGVGRFADGLSQLNNEQANMLRQLFKQTQLHPTPSSDEHPQLIDQLTRLNNELANTHRELSKTYARLQESVDLRQHLIGMAAHDLRNPLGVIQGYSDFLARRLQDRLEPQEAAFLERIRESCQYMRRLLDDFLEWSRGDAGHMEFNITAQEVGPIVQKALAMSALAASHKQIAVRLIPLEAPIWAMTDGDRLCQVLDNLLSNALKFSPSETQVTVRVEATPEVVRLQVEDQGPGIAADEQVQLFQPFYRASSRPTAGEPSTGLGLAMCRTVMQGLKGRLGVTSRLGEGSTFWLELPPVKKAPALQSAPETSQS